MRRDREDSGYSPGGRTVGRKADMDQLFERGRLRARYGRLAECHRLSKADVLPADFPAGMVGSANWVRSKLRNSAPGLRHGELLALE